MPSRATGASQREMADSATPSSHDTRDDDDFSCYRELGFASPEDLREVVESSRRIRRGEEETYSMEEVFAELEMEDSLQQASKAPVEKV